MVHCFPSRFKCSGSETIFKMLLEAHIQGASEQHSHKYPNNGLVWGIISGLLIWAQHLGLTPKQGLRISKVDLFLLLLLGWRWQLYTALRITALLSSIIFVVDADRQMFGNPPARHLEQPMRILRTKQE